MSRLPAPVEAHDVADRVAAARRVVPMTWGLDTFVASNPLHGFEDLPFEEAAAQAADLFDAHAYPPHRDTSGRAVLPRPRSGRRPSTQLLRRGTAGVADLVDAVVAHWCATHLGSADGGPVERGLYASWTSQAAHDPDLRKLVGRGLAGHVQSLPERPEEAIATLLARLEMGPAAVVPYLEAQLARLPGWAAAWSRRHGVDELEALVDFVATRLAVEHLLLGAGIPVAPPVTPTESAAREMERTRELAEAQDRAEAAYRDTLLHALTGERPPAAGTSVDAQVVCCIDVRSEGLRRHIESQGAYETFGFAGFFGLPIAFRRAPDRGHHHDAPSAAEPHCPVILDPQAILVDERVGRSHDLHHAFLAAKRGPCSGFVLADASGWILGLRSIGTSLGPGLFARVARRLRPATPSGTIRLDPGTDGTGLSLAAQTDLARNALTAMGLTSGFAPLVVLCGHRSDHRNNPYRSALHCGACGGNPGGDNAAVLAAICNRPEVRAGLTEHGLHIGDDTWFVAAEHETTDDTVTILDAAAVPARFADRLDALARDLTAAGAANRIERLSRSAGVGSHAASSRRLRKRSTDPALVAPEWGLARNAAIVIGPRTLTAGLDLDRRVFLHSYDAEADTAATVLEAIMAGPVTVAHWISAQYYFSTVDPRRFGAGSKPVHNVVGRIGVVEGSSFDLRIGLPLESVAFDGRPVHDPLRLLVVIDAPDERVDAVLARQPQLRRLADNGWVSMVARGSSPASGFVTRSRTGEWEPWTTGTPIGDAVNCPSEYV